MKKTFVKYLTFLLALCCTSSAVAGWSEKVLSSNSAEIVVSTIYGSDPSLGLLPLQVEVTNKLGEEGDWKITSECNYHGSSGGTGSFEYKMSVPPVSKKRFKLIANTYLNHENGSSAYCSLRLTGVGVSGTKHIHIPREEQYGKAYTPRTLIGSELRDFHSELKLDFGRSRDAFEKKKGNKNDAVRRKSAGAYDFSGALISKQALPHNWRAYLPAKQVWLTGSEYSSIKKIQKDALDSWVMQGGSLFLVGKLPVERVRDLDQPQSSSTYWTSALSQEKSFGLGRVVDLSPDSFEDMVADYRGYIPLLEGHDSSILTSVDFSSSPVASKVPWTGFLEFDDSWIKTLSVICLFIYTGLVFIICLLRMAQSSPVAAFIKLAGLSTLLSAGIVSIVMFGDGFGVKGERNLAVILDSKNGRELVFQEQGVRAGTVLSREMSLSDDVMLRVAAMASEEKDVSSGRRYNRGKYKFSSRYSGERHDLLGDFLKDRTYGHHLLQKVSKTRSKLSLVSENSNLFVSSSLPVTLDNFHYRDRQGVVWMASKIVPGERTQLSLATKVNLKLAKFSDAVEKVNNKVLDRKNYFFASTKSGSHYAISWFEGTKWRATETFVSGPLEVKG